MANFNKWIGLGNLTRDPELRYAAKGTAVCNFGMAINRKYQETEEVLFVNLTAFGKQAETISQYCRKGSSILVEARIKNESYTNKAGVKVDKLAFIVESFQFVGGKKAEGAETAPAPATTEAPAEGGHGPAGDDDVPF